MLINQGTTKCNRYQTLGRFPQLTSVQQVFPDPFPRASDITLLLGKASLPLLGCEGDGFGSAFLLPLQLPDGIRGIGSFKSTARKCQAFVNKFELGGEHVLLLDELAKGIVVLAIARDVGNEPELVGSDGGIAEFLEVCSPPNEHVMEPGG